MKSDKIDVMYITCVKTYKHCDVLVTGNRELFGEWVF